MVLSAWTGSHIKTDVSPCDVQVSLPLLGPKRRFTSREEKQVADGRVPTTSDRNGEDCSQFFPESEYYDQNK